MACLAYFVTGQDPGQQIADYVILICSNGRRWGVSIHNAVFRERKVPGDMWEPRNETREVKVKTNTPVCRVDLRKWVRISKITGVL